MPKKITNLDSEGIEAIIKYEGLKLAAYKCPAGVWTISAGVTYYPNGKRVKEGDRLNSKAEAIELFKTILAKYEQDVDNMTRDDINQQQFNALVSFCYNLGAQSLKGSTLLKKVNANPNDAAIAKEFIKWVYSTGKKLKGLVLRREDEIKMYFKK